MTDERQSDNTARRDEAGQRTRPEGSPLSAVGSSGTAQGGDHHRTSPSAPLLPRTMSATAPAPPAEETPIRWRELFGVLSLIVLADVTIYRGEGFAGLALLFAAAVPLFWLSSPHGHRPTAFWVTGTMLLVLAAKLLWCGSALLVAIGFAWLVAFAMALDGLCPYVPEVLVFAAQTIQAGLLGIIHYARRISKFGVVLPRAAWMNFVLPAVALLAFGFIFVLANPDLALAFGDRMQRIFEVFRSWLERFSPEMLEVCFCTATLWIVLGLLRPVLGGLTYGQPSGNGQTAQNAPAESSLYPAFRNTLLAVIALFGVYLVFEFNTLWFREFPKGFYYSGYAHEGAAWLTAALALATLMLSLVFRGEVLRDPRIITLRRLAWLWSLENMLLAAAVYNRLFIYIGFNGMSRMRIVGLYGMTAVVVGFVFVLVKIANGHGFLWLIRRHLWTLAIGIYLLALTPTDAIVVRYNVQRILAGDPAPSIQISVHPINSEGVLLLRPLLECDDAIIRDGIAAMLHERTRQATATVRKQRREGWSAYQIADDMAERGLQAESSRWARFDESVRRSTALERFHEYAYQWY